MGPDRLGLALAARQHGAVSLAQLLAAGLTRDAVRHRVARGWLTRRHRGVYLVGPLRTPHSHAMAAVLACGQGALLSHAAAAAVWGIAPPRAGAIDVTVSGRNPGSRPGIRLHRPAHLDPRDATRHQGIPITSPARTLLAVEVDGYAFHSSRRAFERDRRRDADLAAHGIRVTRVTWRQLEEEREALVAGATALVAVA